VSCLRSVSLVLLSHGDLGAVPAAFCMHSMHRFDHFLLSGLQGCTAIDVIRCTLPLFRR
jgi:hypothetical protein